MSGVAFHGSIDGRVVLAGNHISGGNVIIQQPPERPDTPPSPSLTVIPYRRDPKFVPRGDFLERIHHLCSKPAGRTALVGLGGVGKSQLAIEFAHRLKEQHTEEDRIWVFWVHASTVTRIEEGFKAIADTLKIPDRNQPNADVLQLVYGWLSNETKGTWCMILDSADDRDVFFGDAIREGRHLVSFLPQSRNGSILLTTRNKDLAYELTGDHEAIIEVGPMTEPDALQLLENRLRPHSDMSRASDLLRALDFIPLAISQAAAYVLARSPRITVAKYLAEFRESERKRVRLLGYNANDLRRDEGSSNEILITWQLSFDYIRAKRLSAADLLSLMSFFNPQGIPEWLLKHSRRTVDNTQESPDSGTDSESLSNRSEIEDEFEDDLAILRDFFLITLTEGDTFEMHGLVQLSMRKWLQANKLYENFHEQYIVIMEESFPIGQYENWKVCRTLFPHTEAAAEHQPKKESVEEIWASLLYKGGWYATSQGIYEIAEQMLSQATHIYEKRLGKGESATLNSMSILARTYRNQGRWEEAEKLEVQVMETCKTKLGVDHPSTLTSMGNLASTLWDQGRWEESEKIQVQVMEAHKIKLGVDHPSTLTSMGNLASTLWNQGRWEESEKIQVQVMETRKTKLGPHHPDTLASMNNLAFSWNQAGRSGDAIALMQQCVTLQAQILGLGHPHTKSSSAALDRWEREAMKLHQDLPSRFQTHT